jgi:hypothetical protein
VYGCKLAPYKLPKYAHYRDEIQEQKFTYSQKPEIEKYVNQIEWEINTLVDTEPQESPSVSFSLTSTPLPKEKMPRKDDSLFHFI